MYSVYNTANETTTIYKSYEEICTALNVSIYTIRRFFCITHVTLPYVPSPNLLYYTPTEVIMEENEGIEEEDEEEEEEEVEEVKIIKKAMKITESKGHKVLIYENNDIDDLIGFKLKEWWIEISDG